MTTDAHDLIKSLSYVNLTANYDYLCWTCIFTILLWEGIIVPLELVLAWAWFEVTCILNHFYPATKINVFDVSMYSLHSLFLPNENSTFLICSITTLWEIRKRSRKIWFMARSDLSLALHFARNDHVWWILLYSCFSYLSCYSCLRFPIDTAVLFMIYLVMNILVHSCYL